MDPVTALATATTAFNLIKKGFQAGRDVEAMYGDIGKWMGAVSDVNHAEKMSKNPPLFKKLFAGSSVEQEAMDAFAAKKKAEAMEDELRSWINMVHGPNAWSELLKMQTKIRKQRAEQLYAQAEFRSRVLNIIGIILLCTIIGGIVMWIGYLFYLKRTGGL
ncbi:peptidase [uncultured Mediterranean phage uvMED]|nr:peptidase [uncultured Mediterranean phage uvMED]BAQ87178.1 peptidase [uncultured Mediterranean phage uvMED]BAQ87249.1 peptidase [uncultured Mediterranean phage uvMED]BAQ87320.1 peptidase [uncultured Mediterranean phage uvMED]BAQ87350.1 peptidase [uncultured Mediterranean phage uvMED]|tara:strand:+ start:88 stop:570 length:483 start_codon:yes stop_codon:yes gene_type:complete